ncbi:MAG TPA: ribose 5-phosphate isomerase B [Bacteroidia bacterium]|jgi:ribose 5-phosphate isomerase B|nr:ribose 5-phosphate isomerase B [Bacteroidia bacterium]
MTLHIGCDHAGFELKEQLKKYLSEKGHKITDHGCYSSERADYPDHAHKVANAVSADEKSLGILICGSGNGINITANKHKGIRSALCWMPEIASLARQHNNANIIALPARFIDLKTASACVDAFLSAVFEGGRHAYRVNKIEAC